MNMDSTIERKFVVPGEEIISSMEYLPGRNVYREGDSLVSKLVGITSTMNRVISVIPLNTAYIPRAGDMVIAEVSDMQSNGWILSISPLCGGFLPLSGVREYIDTTKTRLDSVYPLGSLLYAKVSAVNSLDSLHVTMQDIKCRKLYGGRILKINTAKIPRLIGKEGSMINMIKDRTQTRIYIGQNGLVWVQGTNEGVVKQAIDLIDRETFSDGLTDRIAAMLPPMPTVSKPQEDEQYDKEA